LIILKILAAILIFGILIFIHELGHFLVARACGVKVLEFSLGMGPRLFTIHGRKTDYSLKALPLGGSCQMKGEMDDDTGDPDCFINKPAWQRGLIILAGPVFNFLLAFAVAIVLVVSLGTDKPVVKSVMDGFPAQEAGIQAGDSIKRINSRQIHLYREIGIYVAIHSDSDLTVTVARADGEHVYTVRPKYDHESGRNLIGMVSSGEQTMPESLWDTIRYSYYEMRYNVLTVIDSLIYVFGGHAGRDSVMGPVGIVTTISDTVAEAAPLGLRILLLTIADYILLLGTNLGVMNLLPFPALDGGRLLFIIFELIFRRPVDRKIEGYVHLAGFAILMLLMVLVAYNDIVKLLRG